jgi:hypothetical protein
VSWSDLGSIAPIVVAVLAAAAVLVVDMAAPGRRRPAWSPRWGWGRGWAWCCGHRDAADGATRWTT